MKKSVTNSLSSDQFLNTFQKARNYATKRHHPDPENVASEAISIALSRDSTPSLSFILAIVHNLVSDYFRLQQRFEKYSNLIDATYNKNNNNYLFSVSDDFKGLLDCLAKSQRDILYYKYVLNYTNEDIAKIKNTTNGAIRVQFTRAHSEIRDKINKGYICADI